MNEESFRNYLFTIFKMLLKTLGPAEENIQEDTDNKSP